MTTLDEIARAKLEEIRSGGTLRSLREITPAVVGELPRIMGIEPFYVFPTAVLLMTFFSLFIGTFLQLLWEDLPITEPL